MDFPKATGASKATKATNPNSKRRSSDGVLGKVAMVNVSGIGTQWNGLKRTLPICQTFGPVAIVVGQ